MISPEERAEQQLATAKVEERYILDCLSCGLTGEAQRVINAWRTQLRWSEGAGASKTTLTRLQAVGVIPSPYRGSIKVK